MAEFFDLSPTQQLDALDYAANESGRPPHLLEKDVWVVWALQHLFTASYGPHLVFKGGTSLSKAYGVIQRFSEDVDLTYDIRAIASDLISESGFPFPVSKSQEKKWSKEIRARLSNWVNSVAAPQLQQDLAGENLTATIRCESDKIFIDYPSLTLGTGYVASSVMLEFGARSTGEPFEVRPVVCDASVHLKGLVFPQAKVQVMRAERTFWEKATAIHVYCAQGAFRGGDRFSRHWHDLTRLHSAGFASAAISDRALAQSVADHKAVFFAEKGMDGVPIDYQRAVSGGLRLVPDAEARVKLEADYQHMVDDGLFLHDVETFQELLGQCRAIEDQANRLSFFP